MIEEQISIEARARPQAVSADSATGGGATEPGQPDAPDEAEELQPLRDPESVNVRVAPPAVTKFRKGLLVGVAGAVLATMTAVSWFALEPAGLELAAADRDLGPALTEASPEELAALPRSYGDASPSTQLGPPLPGDLGRPILAHQRAMASEDVTTPDPAVPPDAGAQAAAAERQQRIEELAQARSAPVLMQVSRSSGPASVLAGATGSNDPGLAQAVVARSEDGVNPNRLRPAASRWQVAAGSTIAASLITGLNSDLPGMVVAQVTEPVFDSATGRAVLIPQGARLLGRYDSRVAFGQRRAMLLWERLVLPDGSSIALDNAPATDAAGYSGVADGVDFHTWQLLRGIGMSTLLGVGTELTLGDREGNLIRALRESVQTNADRAGQKIVERNLDIAPTITVRPGFPVRVLVHKDLVLPPWRG